MDAEKLRAGMQESLAREILSKIKPAQRICLIMHQRPDADALGSAASFGAFLASQKIPFMYYCKTGFPQQEAGFFGLEPDLFLDKTGLQALCPDLIISFDSGDLKHAGLEELLKAEKGSSASITTEAELPECQWDLVILDEILSAVDAGLLKINDIKEFIKIKPAETHLIMTGHKEYPELVELADVVTKMEKIKHPFDKGILAQKGVDF